MSTMSSLLTAHPLPAIENDVLLQAIFNHKSIVPPPTASLEGEVGALVPQDNEKLAFLGDQVLRMCVTDVIYKRNPRDNTKELNDKREICVKKKQIAKWSDAYQLTKRIRASSHQQAAIQYSTLRRAQVFQAYIASVYLESGYETIQQWVRGLILESWEEILAGEEEARELAKRMANLQNQDESDQKESSNDTPTPTVPVSPRMPSTTSGSPRSSTNVNLGSPNNSKTYLSLLYEMCVQLGYDTPEWTETVQGPPHQRKFTMAVRIKERMDIQAEGTAKTKVEAKQLAASAAVDMLQA